jgi:transposase
VPVCSPLLVEVTFAVATIGIDAHKNFAEVAILEPGRPVRHRRIGTTPAELKAFVERLGPQDQVVLEASFNTWALADLLQQHAGRVVVSNPMRTKAIASAKIKTDKVDAQVLAQLLAADFIAEVWVPDPTLRALRRRVSQRSALVHQQTALRNRVHAVLNRNLLDCPATDLFGKAGRQWLSTAPLPPEERQQVQSALRLLAALETEIEAVERPLAETALGDPRVRHLMSIPGVGLVTALAIVGVIGDVRRFPRPTQLVGYLGLDPRVRQSGERAARTGHISRQGQGHARGLLIEAAHSAVRTPGPLRAFHDRIRSRRSRQIALVAVARKLAVLAWHLLSDDTDYRWASAILVADKLRQVERKAGQPIQRAPRSPAGSQTGRRDQERRLQLQAEEAYRVLVAARHAEMNAAASNGERLAGSRPDARRRFHPQPPLLSTRVDRVRTQASPTPHSSA